MNFTTSASPEVADFTAPASYVGTLGLLATIFTAAFGVNLVPYVLLAATVLAAVVTLVGVFRGQGTLAQRFSIALRDLVGIFTAIVTAFPHPVAMAKKIVRR